MEGAVVVLGDDGGGSFDAGNEVGGRAGSEFVLYGPCFVVFCRCLKGTSCAVCQRTDFVFPRWRFVNRPDFLEL